MPSTDPIPYHAQLAKTLHGPTLALVLTYLEIHHPIPQDSPDGPQTLGNAPVTIDCDLVCADLGISRRTLHIALNCLGCWFGKEAERVRAVRAGREFFNPNHSPPPRGYGAIKIYSVTGPKEYTKPARLAIRRNISKLATILNSAGFTNMQIPKGSFDEMGATVFPVSDIGQMLRTALPNWSDRRADRWERWRRETGKKSQNPGRMRGAKKSVSSTDAPASGDAI